MSQPKPACSAAILKYIFRGGWGDGSARKVLAVKVGGLDFKPQYPHNGPVTPAVRRQRQVLPMGLLASQSCRVSKLLLHRETLPQKLRWRMSEEDTAVNL